MCPILRGEKHCVSDSFVALAEENEETLVKKVEIIDQRVECDQASNGKSTVTSVVSGQPADSKGSAAPFLIRRQLPEEASLSQENWQGQF